MRVSLFGRFKLECGQATLADCESAKAQELLCYLLLHRQRPHSRETLATFLWSDVSTRRSKKYLRQAIWQLQKMLEPILDSDDQLLDIDSEWLTVRADARLWTDVDALEDAYRVTQHIPAGELLPEQVDQLKDAVQLYQGDLLEGWYQDWCIFEREHYQRIYLLLLEKLVEHCLLAARYAEGIEFGEHVLMYDRAHERTHRRLMRLHFLSGNRTAALRQYDACVRALTDELAVEPGHRTQMLYQQIRLDGRAQGATLDLPRDKATQSLAPSSRQRELAAQLRQIQAGVQSLQLLLEVCLRSLQQPKHDDSP